MPTALYHIHYFNIAHTPNACLPLKILQKHCSPFFLRRLEKGKIRNLLQILGIKRRIMGNV